ncbi:Beta-galactoside-binding lectin 14 kDa lectin [Takifugu flavidus]|uniref:Galectin n=1 Tax=Takifugu flavidus TaxID=433684 RepID=A0A5C6NR16_9TELE|nr:Beta-galactoside-binding lectin 14 kDa lectin [Takifugu flavidus]
MTIKNMSFKFCSERLPERAEITMHLNARFNAHGDENKVVCNSYLGGKWCEEVREGGFPFQQGEEFKMVVEFTPAEFLVKLSDGSVIRFPNRMGAEKYAFFNFDGDVRIKSIEIK